VRRLRLHVAEEAARELRAAQSWWRANRSAVPDAFVIDLRRALELIRTQPNVGVHTTNVRLPGVRRIHLSRLRYDLYYQLASDRQTIMVLALWHSSRGTGPNI
jgi:plasmid stabilization system protein ParE